MSKRSRTAHERRLEQMRQRRAPTSGRAHLRDWTPEELRERKLIARRASVAGWAWLALAVAALLDTLFHVSNPWPQWAERLVTAVGFVLALLLLLRGRKLRGSVS
ncbi:MAG: hypothetical protein ACXVZP_10095 [Gaiellaceae bacterium]